MNRPDKKVRFQLDSSGLRSGMWVIPCFFRYKKFVNLIIVENYIINIFPSVDSKVGVCVCVCVREREYVCV
jgi:hypothetical protein